MFGEGEARNIQLMQSAMTADVQYMQYPLLLLSSVLSCAATRLPYCLCMQASVHDTSVCFDVLYWIRAVEFSLGCSYTDEPCLYRYLKSVCVHVCIPSVICVKWCAFK